MIPSAEKCPGEEPGPDLTAFHSPAFVDALRKVDAGGDDDDGTARPPE